MTNIISSVQTGPLKSNTLESTVGPSLNPVLCLNALIKAGSSFLMKEILFRLDIFLLAFGRLIMRLGALLPLPVGSKTFRYRT